jgi:parvulin-like peptidyl-prolyl isomerase
MKFILTIVIMSCLQLSARVEADDSNSEILAQRGKGVVTQADFDARVARIPVDMRFEVLRNVNRATEVINLMLLRSQMSADAREAGFDQDPLMIDRMRLAAEAELAEAWLKHYIEMQPEADYEALAREYYQLHGDEMRSEEKIDVSHILISTKGREDAEAKALAESVHSQLIDAPALFDELVMQHSEDPSVSSNKGQFKGVEKGDMVDAFESTAFALAPGAISPPVKSQFGYHIIRLDAYIAPKKQRFEEVEAALISKERRKHKDRIQRDYMSRLNTMETELTEEALREMIVRQFGEEVLNSEVNINDSE